MGLSRQEYWSGLPFPSPGDLPDQQLNLSHPHCMEIFYHLSHKGSPSYIYIYDADNQWDHQVGKGGDIKNGK